MNKWERVKENLNELSATIETIKLWSFLAEDGSRRKTNYFDAPRSSYEYLFRAGCFYCELYQVKERYKYENEKGKSIPSKSYCKKFKCPLRFIHLCNFSGDDSAFEKWQNHPDKNIREDSAKVILKAAMKHYKKLTGEDYHE